MANERIKEIDGLRGAAVLLVLLYHFFPNVVPAGFIGVDIFFVVSGFVITQTLINAKNANLKIFFERRVNRLLPSLLFFQIVITIIAFYFYLPAELEDFGRNLYGSSLYINNYLSLTNTNYFGQEARLNPLLHLWSLSVEMQFYFFYPFLIIFLKRSIAKTLVVSIIIFSFCYSNFGVFKTNNIVYLSTHTRIWQIGIGCVLSLYFYKARWLKNQSQSNLPIHLSIFMILVFAFLFKDKQSYPGIEALVPTLLTAIIILKALISNFGSNLLNLKFFQYLGRISYPLYLWHWGILVNVNIILGNYIPIEFKLGLIVISVLLAIFSFEIVEKKFAQYQNLTTAKLLVLTLLSLAVTGIIFKEVKFPRPHSIQNTIDLIRMESMEYRDYTEKLKLAGTERCNSDYEKLYKGRVYCLANKDEAPDIFLLGDSHASALFFGLATIFDNKFSIHNLGSGGCAPFSSDLALGRRPEGGKNCKEEVMPLADAAIKSKAHTIIISSLNSFYLTGLSFTDYVSGVPIISLDDQARELGFRTFEHYLAYSFDKFIDEMAATGKLIIFVLDNPHLYYNPMRCLTPSNSYSKMLSRFCNTREDFASKYEEGAKKIFTEILNKHENIVVLDSFKYLCSDGLCPATENENLRFTDRDHLSINGAKILSKQIEIIMHSKSMLD